MLNRWMLIPYFRNWFTIYHFCIIISNVWTHWYAPKSFPLFWYLEFYYAGNSLIGNLWKLNRFQLRAGFSLHVIFIGDNFYCYFFSFPFWQHTDVCYGWLLLSFILSGMGTGGGCAMISWEFLITCYYSKKLVMCILQTCNDKTTFYQPRIVLFSVLIFYFSLFVLYFFSKKRRKKK